MTVFGDRVLALADSTNASVMAAYDRLVAGEIGEELFVELACSALTIGDARAAALADEGLAAALSRQSRTVVVPVGIAPPNPPDGLLGRLIRGALADEHDPRTALDTASRGRTLETAREAYASGLDTHGVAYWKREPNSGACPACRNLGGVVLPITAKMWTHKGCACTQSPATAGDKEASDVQRSAAAKRAAATRRAAAERERDRRAVRAERERDRRAAARLDPERVARSDAQRAAARARADAILAAAGG